MTFKVLVTCPPMLKKIEYFEESLKKFDIKVTTPEIIQTMSVDELIEIVPKHDGWIIGDDPATYEVFKAGKKGRLKAAVKWGIGVDNVDFNACKQLNIPITNTPGMFGAEVADLAICYMLGLARDAFFIDREIRAGRWSKPSGVSLNGKTLGIMGLGDIGKNIAKRAYSHDLNILGWDPNIETAPNYIDHRKDWPSGIDKCDFIIFACALNADTYHSFNEKILNKLKSGVRIINISRGHLIDEKALLKGLKNKIIDSVALDVFEEEPISKEHPLFNYPRCILGSHNGSNTIDAVIRASNESIKILHSFLEAPKYE